METLDHSYSSAGNRNAVAEVAFAGGDRESETARDFTVRLYLGATALGVGSCSTTSLGIQTLDCTVNLRATVP